MSRKHILTIILEEEADRLVLSERKKWESFYRIMKTIQRDAHGSEQTATGCPSM